MAGLDRMYDACGFIQQYIKQQIRELLEDPMNEYQDPNWVQAALLFEQVVIPCERFFMDELYTLASDIVKVAEQNNNKVIYQQVSGMYNEKILDVDSNDIITPSKDKRIDEYDEEIENIKNWMRKQEKKKIEFENYIRSTKNENFKKRK